jgi:hypothetical protein
MKTKRGLRSLALTLLLLAAVPGSVTATAYSTLRYQDLWKPPGQSTWRTVCVQAGMVDVARNYGQIVVFSNSAQNCTAPNYSVPSGWIGTHLDGWRSSGGVDTYCGDTGIYYSTSATSAWQLWSYLCSNPSGTQSFFGYAHGVFWNGSGYTYTGNVLSPSQNY